MNMGLPLLREAFSSTAVDHQTGVPRHFPRAARWWGHSLLLSLVLAIACGATATTAWTTLQWGVVREFSEFRRSFECIGTRGADDLLPTNSRRWSISPDHTQLEIARHTWPHALAPFRYARYVRNNLDSCMFTILGLTAGAWVAWPLSRALARLRIWRVATRAGVPRDVLGPGALNTTDSALLLSDVPWAASSAAVLALLAWWLTTPRDFHNYGELECFQPSRLAVSIWFTPLLALLICTATRRRVKGAVGSLPGWCPHCAYFSNTPGRAQCPECGEPLGDEARTDSCKKSRRKWCRGLTAVGSIAMVLLCLLVFQACFGDPVPTFENRTLEWAMVRPQDFGGQPRQSIVALESEPLLIFWADGVGWLYVRRHTEDLTSENASGIIVIEITSAYWRDARDIGNAGAAQVFHIAVAANPAAMGTVPIPLGSHTIFRDNWSEPSRNTGQRAIYRCDGAVDVIRNFTPSGSQHILAEISRRTPNDRIRVQEWSELVRQRLGDIQRREDLFDQP